MIVEFKKTAINGIFRDLDDGAVFGFAGGFYIKTAYDFKTKGDTYNAINIEDGSPAFFFSDEEVTEYPKAKTVIE